MQMEIAVIGLSLCGLGVSDRGEPRGDDECEGGTRRGCFYRVPLRSLCEEMQTLNPPKRCEPADRVGWYPGRPVRQAARQAVDQRDKQQDGADEQQLAEFHTDVEQQQTQRNVVLR